MTSGQGTDPLHAFLAGRGTDGRGRTLERVLAFSDDELERVHDYIQWLFPLPTRSMAQPDAPVLTGDAIEAIKADSQAVANLRSAGIATVAASGNDSYVNATNYPACLSSVVSVGNTGLDSTGADAVFRQSNSAPFLSLLAPGTEILAAVPGGGRERHSGTSMAAPHVAGTFALLRQAHPGVSVDQALGALIVTGQPVTDDRDPESHVTKPRIDVGKALQRLSARGTGTAPAPGA
jgi:subtilisin family serine protease